MDKDDTGSWHVLFDSAGGVDGRYVAVSPAGTTEASATVLRDLDALESAFRELGGRF
jgi:hypothetical protein